MPGLVQNVDRAAGPGGRGVLHHVGTRGLV